MSLPNNLKNLAAKTKNVMTPRVLTIAGTAAGFVIAGAVLHALRNPDVIVITNEGPIDSETPSTDI